MKNTQNESEEDSLAAYIKEDLRVWWLILGAILLVALLMSGFWVDGVTIYHHILAGIAVFSSTYGFKVRLRMSLLIGVTYAFVAWLAMYSLTLYVI